MTILQRYLANAILTSTGLVLLVLLGLYTFMDFVAELEDVGKGSYQLFEVLSYLVLSMPKRLYELLPIAALLGTVLGLGQLASQSELVVMRAAGISIQQINKAVMIVAVFLMLLALIIGEVIRPPAEQSARELQSLAQTGTVGARSDNGFWTRDGTHFNHIDEILPNGHFSGISIYEFDDEHRLRVVTKAKEARYEAGEWTLFDVLQSQLDSQGVAVKAIEYARWRSNLNPGMVNIVVVPPEFLPVWSLVEYIDYLKMNHQAVGQYQMAFWTKLIMPLSSAVMVFLAVPFVFGPLRSVSMGSRILVGALAGIGFHLINQSFQHIGLVYGVTPWVAALLPTLVFAGMGYYWISRV